MSPAIFAAVVAAAIMMGGLCIIALIWWALAASQSRHLQRRLQPGGETPNDFGNSNTNPLLQGIAQQGKAIERALDTEGVSSDKLMIRAGWRSSSSRLIFYTLWFLSPLAFVVGTVLVIAVLYRREFHSDVLALLNEPVEPLPPPPLPPSAAG